MQEAGIAPEKSWIYEARTTEEEGRKFAKLLIKSNDIPDAIFSAGDYAALGIVSEFKEVGIQMPIVGFANEPFCSVIEPTLSSVNQHSSKMGFTACQMLLDIIAGAPPINMVITPELIIRQSSLNRTKKK